MVVSFFSLSAAIMTLLSGVFGRILPISLSLALSGALMCGGTFLMQSIDTFWDGVISSIIFGASLGAILTFLPMAWADFFGRENYGSIRGIALSFQVIAQASGPIISGLMWDLNGNYLDSLEIFTISAFCASIIVLFAVPPKASG